MSNLSKMKKDLLFEMKSQRQGAWGIKDFEKAQKIRKKEQKNYEKLQLLEGIIKASEKGNKNDR